MNSTPLYSGSVKDIYEDSEGSLIFKFSDRYSVFDWGEMPDQIKGKGESLAFLGPLFFEYLSFAGNWINWKPLNVTLSSKEKEILDEIKKKGIGNHFISNVEDDPRSFRVKKVNIERPGFVDGAYDYSAYDEKLENSLIPLEVVFRFGLPAGSSLLNRLSDEDYWRSLGLNHKPVEGEEFNRPLIEFSTKLESRDRYITYPEAQNMAGLTDMEFTRLHSICTIIALRLQDFFEAMDVELWDGKFEFAFSELISKERGREIILIDSIGPDELRLVSKGHKLSKEFLRTYYRNTAWLDAVEKSKEMAKQRGTKDWKKIVTDELMQKPSTLSEDYAKAAAMLYPCLANEIAKHLAVQAPFSHVGGLEQLHQLLDRL